MYEFHINLLLNVLLFEYLMFLRFVNKTIFQVTNAEIFPI